VPNRYLSKIYDDFTREFFWVWNFFLSRRQQKAYPVIWKDILLMWCYFMLVVTTAV